MAVFPFRSLVVFMGFVVVGGFSVGFFFWVLLHARRALEAHRARVSSVMQLLHCSRRIDDCDDS